MSPAADAIGTETNGVTAEAATAAVVRTAAAFPLNLFVMIFIPFICISAGPVRLTGVLVLGGEQYPAAVSSSLAALRRTMSAYAYYIIILPKNVNILCISGKAHTFSALAIKKMSLICRECQIGDGGRGRVLHTLIPAVQLYRSECRVQLHGIHIIVRNVGTANGRPRTT